MLRSTSSAATCHGRRLHQLALARMVGGALTMTPDSLHRRLSTAPKSRTELIKALRAQTSAPMKKCVEALDQSGGDVEAAVTLLRKAGLAAAAKKAGRGATDGAVALHHSADGAVEAAAIVEINSETDFVARNEIFQALASDVARSALGIDRPAAAAGAAALDVAALGAAQLAASGAEAPQGSITEALGVAVSQLGENLVLRRACVLEVPAGAGVVAGYVHNAYAAGVGKTVAAVALRSEAASSADGAAALRTLGQKLAMHVVAAQPQFVDASSVDAAALERERSILAEQAAASGKPPEVVAKMVEGRLKKYYGEVCLLEQPYVVDEAAGSVAKVLAAAGKELGATVELGGFVRFQVGEASPAAEEEQGQ